MKLVWSVVLISTGWLLGQSTGSFIATFAGVGTKGFEGDGGPAAGARFASPSGLALDKVGNLYIADSDNNRVRKVTPLGTITTIAGSGTGAASSGDGGPATSARMAQPIGIAVDNAGNLFVAEYTSNRIRRVSLTGTISTVVGSGTCSLLGSRGGYSGDGGPAVLAQIGCPSGVAVDAKGNLYIADSQNNRIRRIGVDGIITTVAGSGTGGGFAGDGGLATAAKLWEPWAVTVDRDGNLYIADTQNNRIRKVTISGVITTVAGGEPGVALTATIDHPRGIAVDDSGNLYIAENQSNYVKKITPAGIVSVVAGTGVANYGGDGGLALAGQLQQPMGLALDASNNLLVADRGNNRIRLVGSGPAMSAAGIVNAASGVGGMVAPGEFVTIFGSGLGPDLPSVAQELSSELAGTRVTFNSTPAIVAFASAGQINVVAPYAIDRSVITEIQTIYRGVTGNRITLPTARASPGIFTINGSGRGQAVVVNQDGTFNSATNPAIRGSIVSFWATGQGQTNPGGIDGQHPQSPAFPTPSLPFVVTIGGLAVPQSDVLFLGLVYAGVVQCNVRVPAGTRAGPLTELLLQIGNNVSLQGATLPAVTLAVR